MNETQFAVNETMLTVTRTFDAPIELVWRAWTEAELLDQWWAPKPWKSETSYMDFSVGGYRLYFMIGPNGEKHPGRTDYLEINHHKNFAGEDSFCDEEGNINPEMPVAKFQNLFEPNSSKTVLIITTEYASETQIQQVIQMGMKEGLSMAFNNLDEVLNGLNSY
ncbi:MAG: SRPBCC domain-containing protein [Bacteroidota bacterium]